MDVERSLKRAVECLESGRLEEAEAVCRQVLEAKRDARALHLLGRVQQRRGRGDLALPLLREAIELDPRGHEFHLYYGNALLSVGQVAEAAEAMRSQLRHTPQRADVYNGLGFALRMQGKMQEAAAAFTQAVQLRPDFAQAYNNLGSVQSTLGRHEQAIATLTRAVQLQPDSAETHNNLGNALKSQGNLEEAAAALTKSIQLRPNYAHAYNNLGKVLFAQGKLDEAIGAFVKAIQLKPDLADAYNGLGHTLTEQGRPDEAVAALTKAIALDPGYALAHNNLGNALKSLGRLDEAMASFERAMALKPQDAAIHSNRVLIAHYHPGYDAAAILREQKKWAECHAKPLSGQIRPHTNDRSPDRPLRIGYVSGDFRWHPVGRFMLPLIEHHDRAAFEIIGYSNLRVGDATTEAFRAACHEWRVVAGLSDEALAEQIRQDRIDILVDLALHTAHNRLLVFARKPAPVQISYLGCNSTTGLETIDYRLTDPYLDPPGINDQNYTEKSIRLPETYWCYRPGPEAPEVASPPVLAAGHITFGCLNNFCKVSLPALEAWQQLLGSDARSRLLLRAPEGSARRRVSQWMPEKGIDPSRITFVDIVPSPQDYYALYRQIDIALDPFPYNGVTSTCDAMWMGVPVVSLAGQTGVSRSGLSLLSTVGLAELVADNPEEYVRIAADLARHSGRLIELRTGLRRRMLQSPLMDAKRFANHVEIAYRKIWTNCGSAAEKTD